MFVVPLVLFRLSPQLGEFSFHAAEFHTKSLILLLFLVVELLEVHLGGLAVTRGGSRGTRVSICDPRVR